MTLHTIAGARPLARRRCPLVSIALAVATAACAQPEQPDGDAPARAPDEHAAETARPGAGPAAGAASIGTGDPTSPPPLGRTAPDTEDVLARARAANEGRWAQPPRDAARSLGVAFRSRRQPRLEVREPGHFVLRLPDPLEVPTPTVHGELVLAGAGNWMGAVRARSGELAWGLESTEMGASTAACEGEFCAWNTYSCTVVVAKATTGRVRWVAWLGTTLLAAPAVADGIVYAGFEASVYRATPFAGGAPFAGGLVALDLGSGAERWRSWLDRDVVGAPVVAGASLYATTWGGTLYDFDRASGGIRAAKTRHALAPPTVDDEGLHYPRLVRDAEGGWLAAVVREGAAPGDATTLAVGGELPGLLGSAPETRFARGASGVPELARWLYPDARARARTPSVAGTTGSWPAPFGASGGANQPYSAHRLYQGPRVLRFGATSAAVLGDELVAFDGGRIVWKAPLVDPDAPPPPAGFTTASQTAASGVPAMRRGFVTASLAAAADRIVAATFDGRILVLDAATGAVWRRYEVGHPLVNEPAVAHGWIYVGTGDGRLVGLDTGDPTLHGWPTAGGNARRDGRAV